MNAKLLEKITELQDACAEIMDIAATDNMYDISIAMDCYHVVVIYNTNENIICVNDVFEIDKNDDEYMCKIGRFEVADDEKLGYRYDAYIAAPSADIARTIAYAAFNDYNEENEISIYIDSKDNRSKSNKPHKDPRPDEEVPCIMVRFNDLNGTMMLFNRDVIRGHRCPRCFIGNYAVIKDKVYVFLTNDEKLMDNMLVSRSGNAIREGQLIDHHKYTLPDWCFENSEDVDDDETKYIKVVKMIIDKTGINGQIFYVEESKWNIPSDGYLQYPRKDKKEYFVFIDPESVDTDEDTIMRAIDIIKKGVNQFPYINLAKESRDILEDLHKRGVNNE